MRIRRRKTKKVPPKPEFGRKPNRPGHPPHATEAADAEGAAAQLRPVDICLLPVAYTAGPFSTVTESKRRRDPDLSVRKWPM